MIVISTSRDPSQRTRSFCKVIARFMNWRYIQRGKKGIEELINEHPEIILVREIKGNPAFLDFYRKGRKIATWRINVGIIKKEKMDDSHVCFAGRVPFNPLMLGALPDNRAGKKFALKMKPKKIVYFRKGVEMDFRYDGKRVLTVKVVRVYESED